jgi:proteic killer suppression protein
MIKSFKHRGLERFYESGSSARIKNEHARRLRMILGRLEASIEPHDMNLPGLKLHELKGRRKGTWSVWVNGNWQITFKFSGLNATEVNYEDYH